MAVTGIGHKRGQFTVYNFEVEDSHSYFVGRNEVLGHNAGPCRIFPKFVTSSEKAKLKILPKDDVALGIVTKDGQLKLFPRGKMLPTFF